MSRDNVIDFPPSRIVRIPPARQEDVRLTFARLIERRLFALTEAAMAGRFANAKSVLPGSAQLPADVEEVS